MAEELFIVNKVKHRIQLAASKDRGGMKENNYAVLGLFFPQVKMSVRHGTFSTLRDIIYFYLSTFICLSIYLPIYLSIHPSIHCSINLFTHPAVHPLHLSVTE